MSESFRTLYFDIIMVMWNLDYVYMKLVLLLKCKYKWYFVYLEIMIFSSKVVSKYAIL